MGGEDEGTIKVVDPDDDYYYKSISASSSYVPIMDSVDVTMSTGEDVDRVTKNLVIASFTILCMIVLVGKVIRVSCGRASCAKRYACRLFLLPSSIISGIIAFLFSYFALEYSQTISSWTNPWRQAPSIFVNLAFATLFLAFDVIGKSIKRLWNEGVTQLLYAMVVAWGQYTVATLVSGILNLIFPKMSPYMGVAVAMGFEGGIATVNALFEEGAFTEIHKEFPDASTYSRIASTIGQLTALSCGIALIALRDTWMGGNIKHRQSSGNDTVNMAEDVEWRFRRRDRGTEKKESHALDSYSTHIGLVCVSIFVAFLITQGLILIEQTSPFLSKYGVFSAIPLFPMCMIVSTIIMKILGKRRNMFNIIYFQKFAGMALEFVVVVSIANIRMPSTGYSITQNDIAFMIVAISLVLWNLFCFIKLARIMCPNFWYERGVVEFGQNLGVYWTGLLFASQMDPTLRTPVPVSYTVKQLIQSFLMGGGLWTVFVLPLQHSLGVWALAAICVSILILWIVLFICVYRKRFPKRSSSFLKKWREKMRKKKIRKLQRRRQRQLRAKSKRKKNDGKKLVNEMEELEDYDDITSSDSDFEGEQTALVSRNSSIGKSSSGSHFSKCCQLFKRNQRRIRRLRSRKRKASMNGETAGAVPLMEVVGGAGRSPEMRSLDNPKFVPPINLNADADVDADADGRPGTNTKELQEEDTSVAVNEMYQNQRGDFGDRASRKSVAKLYLDMPIRMIGISNIAKENYHVAAIRSSMSGIYQTCQWQLLYDLREDGANFSTFLHRCQGHTPVVLLIEDTWGYVFGAFIGGDSIKVSGSQYFGSGESFVFSFEPSYKAFFWTGSNSHFVSVDSDTGIGIGSDPGFAIWLDSEFENGASSESATFDNRILSSMRDFSCMSVEVWALEL